MSLKELLPLLILIAVSTIISAAKKKKQVVSDEHGEQDDPDGEPRRAESPWDDLIRELRKDAPSETRRPEPFSGSRPVAAAQPLSEEDETADEVYSYDREAIETLENRSFFSYEDTPIGENALGSELPREASPTLSKDAIDSDTGSSGSEAFPNGFDPKMAVLYSEILKPRF